MSPDHPDCLSHRRSQPRLSPSYALSVTRELAVSEVVVPVVLVPADTATSSLEAYASDVLPAPTFSPAVRDFLSSCLTSVATTSPATAPMIPAIRTLPSRIRPRMACVSMPAIAPATGGVVRGMSLKVVPSPPGMGGAGLGSDGGLGGGCRGGVPPGGGSPCGGCRGGGALMTITSL